MLGRVFFSKQVFLNVICTCLRNVRKLLMDVCRYNYICNFTGEQSTQYSTRGNDAADELFLPYQLRAKVYDDTRITHNDT